MSSHQVFNGVDETIKAQLEAYWAKKLPRLEKLLVHYPDDLREIRLTVFYHPRSSRKPSFYEADGVIQLPTGTLVAEANDRDAHVTLDRIADTLVNEIKRHNELVRRDDVFKRKSHQRTVRARLMGCLAPAGSDRWRPTFPWADKCRAMDGNRQVVPNRPRDRNDDRQALARTIEPPLGLGISRLKAIVGQPSHGVDFQACPVTICQHLFPLAGYRPVS